MREFHSGYWARSLWWPDRQHGRIEELIFRTDKAQNYPAASHLHAVPFAPQGVRHSTNFGPAGSAASAVRVASAKARFWSERAPPAGNRDREPGPPVANKRSPMATPNASNEWRNSAAYACGDEELDLGPIALHSKLPYDAGKDLGCPC